MTDQARLAQLEAELTAETMRMLLGYAAKRCAMLRAAGIHVDSELLQQLAQDAISDTAIGTLAWDPSRCKLSTHLCGAVKSRTHQMLKQSQARNRSLNNDERGIEGPIADKAALEQASICPDPKETLAQQDLAAKVVASLYESAQHDEHVTLLLMAYEDGEGKRADVIASTGMTDNEYDNARKRLTRLLDRLPAPFRADATETLGGTR